MFLMLYFFTFFFLLLTTAVSKSTVGFVAFSEQMTLSISISDEKDEIAIILTGPQSSYFRFVLYSKTKKSKSTLKSIIINEYHRTSKYIQF